MRSTRHGYEIGLLVVSLLTPSNINIGTSTTYIRRESLLCVLYGEEMTTAGVLWSAEGVQKITRQKFQVSLLFEQKRFGAERKLLELECNFYSEIEQRWNILNRTKQLGYQVIRLVLRSMIATDYQCYSNLEQRAEEAQEAKESEFVHNERRTDEGPYLSLLVTWCEDLLAPLLGYMC